MNFLVMVHICPKVEAVRIFEGKHNSFLHDIAVRNEGEGGPESQICHGSGRRGGKVHRHDGHRPRQGVKIQTVGPVGPVGPCGPHSISPKGAISPLTQVSPSLKLKRDIHRRERVQA